MKSKEIICFVYQDEKEEIIQAMGNKFTIFFSEDFDDTKKLKPKNCYIVSSLKMAHINIDKFKRMLLDYQNNDYPILHDNDGKFSNEVLDVFWEAKKPYHNFTTSAIIDNLLRMD